MYKTYILNFLYFEN